MTRHGKFKNRGKEIHENPPASMKDFLNDQSPSLQEEHSSPAATQETEDSGKPIKGSEPRPEKTLDRLHIQIRRDLKIKLKKAVFERSLQRSRKNGASERAVIEEALEEYLQDF